MDGEPVLCSVPPWGEGTFTKFFSKKREISADVERFSNVLTIRNLSEHNAKAFHTRNDSCWQSCR